MLFLVTCVYDEGVYESSFRLVEAPSRLAVAQHMMDNPYDWHPFLQGAYLFDTVVRGDSPYYADPHPITAEELLRQIDATRVDGDSSAQLAIHPVRDILRLPDSDPTPR